MNIKDYRLHIVTKSGKPVYTHVGVEKDYDPFGLVFLRDFHYKAGDIMIINKSRHIIHEVIFGVFGSSENLLFDIQIIVIPEPF